MNLVAINFKLLVLQIVILTATLQQEGNAFLSFLEIELANEKLSDFLLVSEKSSPEAQLCALASRLQATASVAPFVPAQTT